MIKYGDQKVFVELEGTGKLLQQLPNAVNELDKDGRPLVVAMVTVAVANALMPGERKE